ncbi:DUF4118 domain-containing protein [Kitasatospora sp. NBC_01287]|uniref:DUF4118 domain-containing protein n=1 Tax=Kitasatospora sp. NBC_01287 TaxID=2903573 RepID=UPI00225177FD|nr:DUF4118 domain-containing protein [Kitasatospora sp. NBC_01287]MCX4744143.1 DUF4118 domain-containing protein [Kitasatospora sp. NBC_01287]
MLRSPIRPTDRTPRPSPRQHPGRRPARRPGRNSSGATARHPAHGPLALLAAVAAPLALCAVLLPFRGGIANTNVALLLVVVVVAVAALGRRSAGAVAAVVAALCFDFFFTRPYEQFAISKSADLTTAALLLAVGLAVSQLAARARRFRVLAITDAGYLTRIRDTAALARSANSALTVVDQVRDQLVELLQLRGCRFEYGSLLGRPPRLEHDGSIVVGQRSWDADRLGLPDEDVELRMFGNGTYIGRFMLEPTPGAVPSRQARLVAVTLASQAGAALDSLHRPAKAA